MTDIDKEIIKDLKVWVDLSELTEKPPFVTHEFLQQLLDLINRTKLEAKRYRGKCSGQKVELTRLYEQVRQQKAENERLEAENKLLIDRNCELAEKGEKAIIAFVKSQNEAKYEVIKELIECLREKGKVYWYDFTEYVLLEDIENFTNELTHKPTKIEHNSLCETETYESR